MKDLQDILEPIEDISGVGVYVISDSTKQILYANTEFKNFFPGYEENCFCHQLINGDELCSGCSGNLDTCSINDRFKTKKIQGLWKNENASLITLQYRNHQIDLAQHNDFTGMLPANLNAGIKILEYDENETFYYAGKNTLNMLGYTYNELIQATGGTLRGLIYPPESDKVMSDIKTQLDKYGEYSCEYRVKSKSGEFIWVMDNGKLFTDKDGKKRINSIITDITTMKNTLDTLQYQTTYDELTGIYNKNTFYEKTKRMLHDNLDKEYLIIRWDVEHFKIINDLFGTSEGDKLLRYISHMLNILIENNGTYGRVDADIFLVCIENKDDAMTKMMDSIEEKLRQYPIDFELIPCFGVYIINRDEQENVPVSIMCDRANLALRTVKGNYMKRYAVYSNNLREDLVKEHEITSEMNTALEEEQFEVYLQPKFDLATEKIVGAEALVRWIHPTKGMISPGVFIPIFERNGFIMRLDEYIWDHTCRIMKRWIDEGRELIPISINISRIDLYNPHLCEIIISLVKKYNIVPKFLELEITESAYTENLNQILPIMKRLQDNGFIILMDDFGAGYSSLNMLKDVPIDVLKIDMNFLRGAVEQGKGKGGVILNSVVRMAKWLSLPVVAEGVETNTQVNFLRSIGCDTAQGFYYSRPIPVPEFEDLMEKYRDNNGICGGVKSNHTYDKEIDELWNPESETNILFDELLGAVAIFDVYRNDGNIEVVRVNNEYFKLFGVSDKSKYDKNILSFVHQDDVDKLLQCVANVTPDRVQCTEIRCIRDNDECIWVHMSVRKLVEYSPDRAMMYASMFDITEIKEKQLCLESDNTMLAKGYEALSTGVVIYNISDGSFKTEFINTNMLNLLGCTREEYDKNIAVNDYSLFSKRNALNILHLASREKKPSPMELHTHLERSDKTTVSLTMKVSTVKYSDTAKYVYVTAYEEQSVPPLMTSSLKAAYKMILSTEFIVMRYIAASDKMVNVIDGERFIIENYISANIASTYMESASADKFNRTLKQLSENGGRAEIDVIAMFDSVKYENYRVYIYCGKKSEMMIYWKNVQHEKELSEDSEEKNKLFNSFATATPNAFVKFSVRDDYRIIYSNNNFRRISENLIKDSFLDIIYYEDVENVVSRIAEAVREHYIVFGVNARIVTKQGLLAWYRFNGGIEYSDDDIVVSLVLENRTECKVLDQAVKCNERFIELLKEKCSFIYNINLDKNYIINDTVLNESALSLRHCGTYTELFDALYENIHPEFKNGFAFLANRTYLISEFANGNTKIEQKCIAVNKDGEYKNALLTFELYTDSFTGDICCILSAKPIGKVNGRTVYDDMVDFDLVSAYKIDFAKGEVEQYRGADSELYGVYTYDEFCRHLTDAADGREYRRKLKTFLSKNNIDELYDIVSVVNHIEYPRVTSKGTSEWVRLTFKLVTEESGKRVGYISIYNIDIKNYNAKGYNLFNKFGDKLALLYDNILEFDYMENDLYRVIIGKDDVELKKICHITDSDEWHNNLDNIVIDSHEREVCEKLFKYSNVDKMDSGDELSVIIQTHDDKNNTNWNFVSAKKLDWNDNKKHLVIFVKNINDGFERKYKEYKITDSEFKTISRENKLRFNSILKLSRDIREPMNIISAMCFLIKKAAHDDISPYMTNIETAVKYMLTMIDSTIDVVKADEKGIEIRKKHFNAQMLINDIEKVFRGLDTAKNVTFGIEYDSDISQMLIGDDTRTEQILMMLLTNAFYYTGEMGNILLKAESVSKTPSTELIRFTVRDSGVGFDENVLEHIFKNDELCTVIGSDSVTEFGLNIVNKLVETLDGKMQINSKKDCGSEIIIDLPFGISKGKPAETKTDYKFDGEVVLIVDDEVLYSEVEKQMLECVGLKAETAVNGKTALEMIKKSPVGYYKAILMDIRMPVMNGKEAAVAIRRLPRIDVKTIPIIAISADVAIESIEFAKKIGMDEYIIKPVDRNILYDVLHKYLKN